MLAILKTCNEVSCKVTMEFTEDGYEEVGSKGNVSDKNKYISENFK